MKNALIYRLCVVASLSLPFFALSDSVAQTDSYIHEVNLQLLRAARALYNQDINPTHEPFVGKLKTGRARSLDIRLRAGVDYAILGVCDRDCYDMDIFLYDQRGVLVAQDTERDPVPIVTVTPWRTSVFTIEVEIPDCYAFQCTFGVAAFEDNR